MSPASSPAKPAATSSIMLQIEECGLLPDESLIKIYQQILPDVKDDDELLIRLVEARILTAYQAKKLRSRQGKGLVLGNYVIQKKLGSGGMGVVYLAVHRRMERQVALKVLSAKCLKQNGMVERFGHEIKAASRLTHPNVVAAFDADEVSGVHFFVMEYVQGQDLAQYIAENGPLDFSQAINCLLQAARGLAYAHRCGVIHRDIKPHNLLLDHSGTIKILDMGLARLDADQQNDSDGLTATGNVMGTVDFMSPEQALNSKQADARSDLYSLGCTFFYLLNGKSVYTGSTVIEKILAHREQPIPALDSTLHDEATSEALEHIFRKMVAKNPEERYQTASELVNDLEQYQAANLSPSVLDETDFVVNCGSELYSTPGLQRKLSAISQQETVNTLSPQEPTVLDTIYAEPSENETSQRSRMWWVLIGLGYLMLMTGFAGYFLTRESPSSAENSSSIVDSATAETSDTVLIEQSHNLTPGQSREPAVCPTE